MARVFISHSHKDKPLARRIYSYLTDNSTEAWLDENEILVGDSIPSKIQGGITNSDYILVILSRNSVQSGWVKKEVETKLMREITTGSVSVLCILGERIDYTWSIPAFLESKKYADITEDFEHGMREVLRAIKGHSRSSAIPKSRDIYTGYVLGFTAAKLAWYHGEPIQFFGLKVQFKGFADRLSLDKTLTEEILKSFGPTKDLGEVLENAQRGIETRNILSGALISQHGDIVSAAFRFGFNLIFLMPQLEFLQVAQESKSENTPPGDLMGPLESQFNNLVADAQIIGLGEEKQLLLRKNRTRASDGHAEEVRNQLIELGANLERDFKI